jgi:hypothetical protein
MPGWSAAGGHEWPPALEFGKAGRLDLSSLLRKIGLVAAGCAVIAAGGYLVRRQLDVQGLPTSISTALLAQPVGDLPNVASKQTPASYTLDGCPPEGNGGDLELNLLKNRSDPGHYTAVSFDTLTALTWPKNVERLPMMDWPKSGRDFIQQYAGTPITVEGYIVSLREGPPEAANCSRTTSGYLDWHLAFTKGARDARSQSVLAEVTPRVRLQHDWTMDSIHSLLINDHLPVRLSGWLYFDPEHPGDLGVTRSTLWEINPVMQIHVWDGGRWVPLEGFAK